VVEPALTGVTPVPLFHLYSDPFSNRFGMWADTCFPLACLIRFDADTGAEPCYAFPNPWLLEFGFWVFLIWAFLCFLTTFYFCAI